MFWQPIAALIGRQALGLRWPLLGICLASACSSAGGGGTSPAAASSGADGTLRTANGQVILSPNGAAGVTEPAAAAPTGATGQSTESQTAANVALPPPATEPGPRAQPTGAPDAGRPAPAQPSGDEEEDDDEDDD